MRQGCRVPIQAFFGLSVDVISRTLSDAIKSVKQGVSRRLIGDAEHFWQWRAENEREESMRVDDYYRLPLGTKLETGEIQTCTYCGKNGLAELVEGKTFYTHYQSVGFNGRGAPEIRWIMHPQTVITTTSGE